MTTDAPAEAADQNTRVIDGTKEYRIQTKEVTRFLLRTLIGSGGWYAGTKEFARRKRLAKAIGTGERPTDDAAIATWEQRPCEFWLSDKLKAHACKCMTYFLDKGAIIGALEDDTLDALMIDLGIEMKDA